MRRKDVVSPVNGQPLPPGREPWKAGEEAREMGRKGGLKSVEVRRARKTLREELVNLLTADVKDSSGKSVQTQVAVSSALVKQALKGNIHAFEIIRDTIGEKPVEKVMLAEVDQNVIDEVERIVLDDKGTGN